MITLVDVHFDTPSLTPPGLIRQRSVRLIDYMAERETLLLQAGVLHLCQLEQARCEITIRGQQVVARGEEPIRLEDGDLVVIDIMAMTRDTPNQRCTPVASGAADGIPLPTTTATSTVPDTAGGLSPMSNGTIAYTEDDNVNLMQRVRVTRWFFLYTLDDMEPMAEELQGAEMEDPTRTFQHLFLSRQPHMEIDLCFVSPIPRDLQAIDTTPLLYTYAGQIPVMKALIMLDVEIYSNAIRPHRQPGDRPTPADEWREISQVSTRVTRSRFLGEMGLTHLCEGENQICILLHRDQVWPTQDDQERTIHSCDYVIAKVKKTDELDNSIATQACSSRGPTPEQNTPEHGRTWESDGETRDQHQLPPSSAMSLLQRKVQRWRPTNA